MEPTLDSASMLDVDMNRLKRKLEEESGFDSIQKVDENGNGVDPNNSQIELPNIEHLINAAANYEATPTQVLQQISFEKRLRTDETLVSSLDVQNIQDVQISGTYLNGINNGDILGIGTSLPSQPQMTPEERIWHQKLIEIGCDPELAYSHIPKDPNKIELDGVYQWRAKGGVKGSKLLLEWLKANTLITYLGIANNNLTDSGSNHIASLLKQNKSIKVLDLTKGAKVICEALKENPTIEEINFSKNFLGFEKKGIKFLCDVLRINKNIKSVNISENEIRDVGATMIAEMLKLNKSLTSLDLSTNSIAWEGIYSLIDGLKENTTLKQLILGNVAMPDPPKGEAGAKYLKKSVEELQTFAAQKPDFTLTLEGWPPYYVKSYLEMEKLN